MACLCTLTHTHAGRHLTRLESLSGLKTTHRQNHAPHRR